MEMKREMSFLGTPGDDQRIFNSYYVLEAGEDRKKDLEQWEALLKNTTIPFVLRSATFMIYDDHLETQADADSMATRKNPKKTAQCSFGRCYFSRRY